MYTKINEAAEYLKSKINNNPKIAIVLGSGLSSLADIVENKIEIDYKDIPGFSVSTVVGHAGKIVSGNINGVSVFIMQGRIHFYEGYKIDEVVLPIRVMKAIGIEKLILTNSSGAVNTEYTPGDLVILNDHINLTGLNPLIGKNMDEFGPRFPDMSSVYDKELINKIREIGNNLNLNLKEGVYAWMTGPSYETPSEVKMIRILGGDVVGMSTAPEAIVANHQGMKVAAISCATNMAAGILQQPLNHKEVVETAKSVESKMISLLKEIVNI